MRIKDKIEEIEKYIEQFADVIPETLEEYKFNLIRKAACERYVEKIIEAVVDLAFLVIKEKNLEKPEDDKAVFDILCENSVIPKELGEKLKDAKGMRNILAHEYGKIDDEIVFEAITEELEDDVIVFIKCVKIAISGSGV